MILNQCANGIGRITISRPDKANALTEEMLIDLITACEALGRDRSLRAIIITGAGKVFSAGADLDAARAGLALSPAWEKLSACISEMPCLTIAALNGTAAGGAMGMVLACDLRVAVAGAKMFYPVMRLGYLPQPSDPGRLVALVGPARAKMILMAGQKITVEEAVAWGLVDLIVPADRLMAEAEMLCGDVVGASAEHVAAIKQMIMRR